MIRKSILPVMLAAMLALVPLLASCGEAAGAGKPETAAAAANADPGDPEAASTEDPEADSLPADLDFEGISINIACYADSHAKYFNTELTGDVYDDALHFRNTGTEERLNVKLNPISLNVEWGAYLDALRKVFNAGDDVYDALYLWEYDFCPISVEGCFLDISDAPYIDTSKPWWAGDYMANAAIDNSKSYFLFGDFTPSMINSMTNLFFNKKMYSDMIGDPDQLYATVLDGGWTFEKMTKTVSGWYSDVNGDGTKDINDRYGMVIYDLGCMSEGFLNNMGCTYSYRDANGLPIIDPLGGGRGDRLMSCIDRMIAFRARDEVYIESRTNPTDMDITDFTQGNFGFMPNYLSKASKLREMEDEYGIIPYPKYDETQEQYITDIHNAVMMAALPYTCSKPDAVCATFESLAYLGYKDVIPVYYEMMMKAKYTRDELSSQVIDLLHDTIHYEFAYIYNNGLTKLVTHVRSTISSGENTYASWWAENEEKIQGQLQAMIDMQLAH